MTPEEKFCDLLERVGDLTPDECTELQKLSRELDALDCLDEQIHGGFCELERTGKLVRMH